MNTIGIHIAAKIDLSRHNIIRIAPICNGKLFLSQRNLTPELLDIPIERSMDGTIEEGKKYALKAVKKITLNNVQPRLILHYNDECSCGTCNGILLFILPLKTEKDIMLDGKFFNFEDIEKNTHLLNPSIKKELEHLKNAASLWKDFYL